MALFGSDTPTQQTQTSTFTPSAEQKRLMDLALPGIEQFAAQGGVKNYAGPTVAGFDPAQEAAQAEALGPVAEAQRRAATGASNTHGFWTGSDIWSPQQNAMLQKAQEAAVRPITDNFLQSVLPSLRSDAIMSGGYGGSSLQKGENLATGTAARQVGDTSAKLVADLYGTNVNAQMDALRQTPTVQQAQIAPAQTVSAVGDARQALEQAKMQDAYSRHMFDQYAPLSTSQEIASLIGAFPGGTTTSTANNPDQPSAWKKALSGALAGGAAGSSFGPWGTAIGALGGAGLSFA